MTLHQICVHNNAEVPLHDHEKGFIYRFNGAASRSQSEQMAAAASWMCLQAGSSGLRGIDRELGHVKETAVPGHKITYTILCLCDSTVLSGSLWRWLSGSPPVLIRLEHSEG